MQKASIFGSIDAKNHRQLPKTVKTFKSFQKPPKAGQNEKKFACLGSGHIFKDI